MRKRNTQERVRSFVGPYSRIGYGEDKETQLRITLRWRLMGGNKKGHRVATAAPIYGGEREEFPSTRDTVLRGGEMPPHLVPHLLLLLPKQPRLGALRARSVISASRRVWTATCRRSGQCCNTRGYSAGRNTTIMLR